MPTNSSIYSAIALTYHLRGEFVLAVDYYQHALALNSDDIVAKEHHILAIKDFVIFSSLPGVDSDDDFDQISGERLEESDDDLEFDDDDEEDSDLSLEAF